MISEDDPVELALSEIQSSLQRIIDRTEDLVRLSGLQSQIRHSIESPHREYVYESERSLYHTLLERTASAEYPNHFVNYTYENSQTSESDHYHPHIQRKPTLHNRLPVDFDSKEDQEIEQIPEETFNQNLSSKLSKETFDSLTCSVCFDTIRVPYKGRCGHIFCKRDALRLHQCPNCRVNWHENRPMKDIILSKILKDLSSTR